MADSEHKGFFGRLPEKVKTGGTVAAVLTAGSAAWSKLIEYTLPATVNYSNTYKDLVPITPETEIQLAATSANEPYVTAGILLVLGSGLVVSKYRKQIKSGLAKADLKLGEVYDYLVVNVRGTKSYDDLLERRHQPERA